MGQPSEILSLDFETFSQADLRKIGAHAYARHPSTGVICLAWAFDDEPAAIWLPGQPMPKRVILHIMNGGIVCGWNVAFEWLVWNYVLCLLLPSLPRIEAGQLRDTMAAAAYWGLPLGLDQAAKAAKVNVLKDADGHRLMLQMCRPRSVDPFGRPTWWHQQDAAKLARLVEYCLSDVDAERAIARAVRPLPPKECAYWSMDLEMNALGVPVDLDLVYRLAAVAQMAAKKANADMHTLTGGMVSGVTSTAALQRFLNHLGYPHDNLRKGTVEERLDDPFCDGLERMLLELRADNAKTSAAKLQKMAGTCSHADPWVRGMLQYYGALRTGRWAGRLIQMQNLPRGFKQVGEAIEAIRSGVSFEMLELFYGPAMGIVSAALRGCIAAPEGYRLFVADFSQIEARVLAWIAGQRDILEVFARGEDPYIYTARQQGSEDRQFGKVLVLALGFGMGAEAFQRAAAVYGITLTLAEADAAVQRWRGNNRAIKLFWYKVGEAVQRVIGGKGTGHMEQVGPLQFGMMGSHMLMKLPSGRVLIYRDASVMKVHHEDGSDWVTVTYWGLNQYTRKWDEIRTWGSKVVENAVQAIARDLMAEACLQATEHLLPLVLMVHDELIGVASDSDADRLLAKLLHFMKHPPSWAAGCPIDAVGWVGTRYKK